GLGKILMGRAIFGAKIHGGLQQRDGFVQVTFLQKDDAEVVLGNIVVRSDCKRMRKQRFAIAPVRRLNRGAPTQETNHNCSAGSQNFTLPTPSRRDIGNTPGDRYVKADLW